MERRKALFPDRPLIRISSTFFWHLSSDYDLTPIPMLAARGRAVLAISGDEGGDSAVYEPMKVGQQVQKYAPYCIDPSFAHR